MSEDANGPYVGPSGQVRPAMNQEEFDAKFAYKAPAESLSKSRLKKFIRRYYSSFLSLETFVMSVISFIPIIGWMPKYSIRENFIMDVVGGLTVGIMHVPQGIAYASLAHVDPVVGLYTSFFPPLLYMIFGTSRHNSIGSFAVVSLMAGLAVDRLVNEYNSADDINLMQQNITEPTPKLTSVEVASVLTFTIGLVNILMGMLHLEFITTYFSDQVVSGFSTAASMHVFVSQLRDIFSIHGLPKRTGFGQLFLRVYDILSHIHMSNPYTVLIAVLSIAFLLIGKIFIAKLVKRKFNCSLPIPFELILVIIATFLSALLHLHSNCRIRIVSHIPSGLPSPKLPRFDLIPQLIADSFGIAAVIIAIHISLAKMFAKKLDYEIDAGQELYAIGFTAAVSSFFPVYPMACSLGRTLVNVSAGTKTQLSAIFSSALLFAVIIFFGRYLRTLPMCVLSAIIIVALRGMFQKFGELKRLWPLSTIDFLIWLVSFTATVVYDVMQGLIISLAFALMTTVFRTQWSRWHLLANLEGTNDYRDSERYHAVTNYDVGVCVFRFDSPLLFTNVERFKRIIYKVLKQWRVERPSILFPHGQYPNDVSIQCTNASRVLPEQKDTRAAVEMHPSRHFIIDCSGFTFVDFMGVNAIKEIFAEMRSERVLVYFAAAKAPVRELFDSSGFHRFVPKENFYPTIRDAVSIARQRQRLSIQPKQLSELSYDPVKEMEQTHPRN
ncbi:unnamed protein product [Anisakis simplex]|uniref:STAS domain-containing protein n=1 Tax=Anisakis simplex TaxID=6269 RepID=A0A158PNN7_ANISI|nr:unnamed protein product [Anisakis simplex]